MYGDMPKGFPKWRTLSLEHCGYRQPLTEEQARIIYEAMVLDPEGMEMARNAFEYPCEYFLNKLYSRILVTKNKPAYRAMQGKYELAGAMWGK